MNELSCMLSEKDLLLLVQVLMPGLRDKQRMVKILRDDEDILEGMLTDEKLFRYLIDDPESIIRVSPQLFFTALLHRAKQDLEHQSYTIERKDRHRMVVFDSGKVVDLLKEKEILGYLIDMLVSFVRINSFSVPIRVRKGIWHKFRFSDFDIDSLIKYSQMIDEGYRFQPYKRIADICLFMTGIFPDYIGARYRRLAEGQRRLGLMARWSREGFEEHGKYFYRAASQHRAAQILELHQVLRCLSKNFLLVTKPLTLMSSRYLGFFKEKLFLQ